MKVVFISHRALSIHGSTLRSMESDGHVFFVLDQTAEESVEALRDWESENPPDLAVIEMLMECRGETSNTMNFYNAGLWIYEQMRKLSIFQNVPVIILLSDSENAEDRERVSAVGGAAGVMMVRMPVRGALALEDLMEAFASNWQIMTDIFPLS